MVGAIEMKDEESVGAHMSYNIESCRTRGVQLCHIEIRTIDALVTMAPMLLLQEDMYNRQSG